MIVIAHNIRSAHNIGSILRTADALGISKIFLTGYSPAPIDRFGKPFTKITKVSLGAEQSVKWSAVKNISPLLARLSKQGYKLVALEQHANSTPLSEYKASQNKLKKTVLLLGNEVTGLSSGLLKKVDTILEIPMKGKKESLNVSVAFGIAAYWLTQSKK